MAAPARARRRGATASLLPPKRQLDVQHLLSAVVGAYMGLVFYSLITPGQIPEGVSTVSVDPRQYLRLVDIHAERGAEGLYHISGRVQNARNLPCSLAAVRLRFYDAADHEVSHTVTTVQAIPAHGAGNFELRAYVRGAARFEAGVDLAQF